MEHLEKLEGLSAFLAQCIRAFNDASLALTADDSSLFQSFGKGAGGDTSIGADLVCEKIFTEYLSTFGVIYSEESGTINNPNLEYQNAQIFLDPLDGSNNFKAQIPYYGVSIHRLFTDNSQPKESLVGNFCNGEIILRSHKGSFRANLREWYLHKTFTLKPLVYAKQTNIGIFEGAYEHSSMGVLLQNHRIKFRSPGALALSLSLAHRLKFVLRLGSLRNYDISAGVHISEGMKYYKGDNVLCISHDDATQNLLLELITKYQKGL